MHGKTSETTSKNFLLGREVSFRFIVVDRICCVSRTLLSNDKTDKYATNYPTKQHKIIRKIGIRLVSNLLVSNSGLLNFSIKIIMIVLIREDGGMIFLAI